MSESIQHIDVDSDEFIDAPKALRDHVKKLQDQLKSTAGERDQFRSQVQANALSGVLAGFKAPERVKRDLLDDKVDPLDSEAVNAWLASNGDAYAKGEASPVSSDAGNVTEEERAAQQRISSSGEFKQPADMSKLEAAMAEIGPDTTREQMLAIYQKHGL